MLLNMPVKTFPVLSGQRPALPALRTSRPWPHCVHHHSMYVHQRRRHALQNHQKRRYMSNMAASVDTAQASGRPLRFIQHKQEAFWFYRFLSIVYDHIGEYFAFLIPTRTRKTLLSTAAVCTGHIICTAVIPRFAAIS